MGNVIYSASPFQAFQTTFLALGAVIVLGVVGLGSALLNRTNKPIARIAMAGAGIVLVLLGSIGAVATTLSLNGQAKIATVQLQKKDVAEQSCNDQSCTHYLLEMQSSATSFNFDIPQSAFDRTEEGQCYAVTYYATGLATDTGGFVSTDRVTKIELLDKTACP